MSLLVATLVDAASPQYHHPANSCTRPVPPLIFNDTACSKRQIAGMVEISFLHNFITIKFLQHKKGHRDDYCTGMLSVLSSIPTMTTAVNPLSTNYSDHPMTSSVCSLAHS